MAHNVLAFVFVAEFEKHLLEQMSIKNTKVDDKNYYPIYNVEFELEPNDAIS